MADGQITIAPARTAGRPPLTRTARELVRQDRQGLRGGLSVAFLGAVASSLENRRLLVAQPFALISGILIYRSAQSEPQTWALLLLFALALMAVFTLRRTFFSVNAALLMVAIVVGMSLLPLHGALFGTPMLRGSVFGTYQATVDAIHSDDGINARIIVSHLKPLDEARQLNIRRARLFMPSGQRPAVGDTIAVAVRLYAVPGPVLSDSYDSQFQSYFDGIGAFGSATGQVTVLGSTDNWSLSAWTSSIRQHIGARIDAALDGTPDAIARALVIGDQGQITDRIRTVMASAGLAHVLAISGLHLTLVAGGVFAAIRMGLATSYWAGLQLDLKRFAALGGIFTALFYLSISGASVSAVRATIMLLLIFGAVLAGRKALTMRNVAIAAIIVIVTDPAAVFRPSFQLSFAAVTALVGVYEYYRPERTENPGLIGRFFRFMAGLALTSVIAGLATGLFAAFHFQQMAPLGILGNLFAVPILSLVVLPSAFLGVFAMPLGFDAIFFSVTGWGIARIVTIAEWVSSLTGGWTSAPPINLFALLSGTAALLCLAFFEGRLRFAGAILLVPLVVFFGMAQKPDVLVADSTQALAVRLDDNLTLVAGRAGTFAVNAWQEGLQEPIDPPAADMPCDDTACFFRSANGFTLSYIKTRDAFAEDCRLADLVITRLTAPSYCQEASQVIDRKSLLSGGVQWARWNGSAFDFRPAIADPGRPWRIQ